MYSAILIVHIFGAILTGVVGLASVAAMVAGRSQWYGMLSKTLAYLATFEVLSGTALAILSLEISVASVCGNVAIYLAFVASIEALLFMRMRQAAIRFPFTKTLSPVSVSLVALLAGLVLGF